MTHFIQTYGLWFLFGIVCLESAGLWLPGETALIAAGVYASKGHLSIVGVIVTFKSPWVTQWTTHSWRVWLAIIVAVSALVAVAIYAVSEYTHRREVPTPTPTPAA